jgi:hypothetical protein
MNELRAAYIYQAYRGNNAMDFHTCVNDIIESGKSDLYAETDTFPYHHKDELTYADAVYVANMIKDADAKNLNLCAYFFDRLPLGRLLRNGQ